MKSESPDAVDAPSLLMVRPASFGFDAETAETNAFQEAVPAAELDAVARTAREEFDRLVLALEGAGVEVVSFEDPGEPVCPSAVFPNNWVSFHRDGTVVLYPMATAGRRREVRRAWVEALAERYRVQRIVDLREGAPAGAFLEGTGSLVLDRSKRIAYAALSPRTDRRLADRFADALGYRLVAFRALDPDGVPIYHTNVMMAVGGRTSFACLECIADPGERERVRASLVDPERLGIELSWSQVCAFAGNALEVERSGDPPVLVLSASARAALGASTREQLEQRVELVSSPIPTIEKLGGGSARCMVAALHLPPAGTR